MAVQRKGMVWSQRGAIQIKKTRQEQRLLHCRRESGDSCISYLEEPGL